MLEKIEVTVSTYNRSKILSKWFDGFLPSLDQYGISVSIYDSSENEETKELVGSLNRTRNSNRKIRYFRIPAETRVDAKVLYSILNAQREYVWPMGDSRTANLTSLNEKGEHCFEENIGYISLGWNHRYEDGKIYHDPAVFFRDMFWQSTLLGGLIFRKDIFAPLIDSKTKARFLSKYCKDDGFSYLGIFYELISNNGSAKGLLIDFKFEDIKLSKKPNWLKRYLEVWCENLCYLVDCLPMEYSPYKNEVLRETWKKIGCDGWYWLLRARVENGINPKIYKKYTENRILERVTEHRGRIKMVAYMPVHIAKAALFLYTKVYPTIRRTIAKIWRGNK